MGVAEVLVPSKFIFLITHLLITIVILNARQENIFAAYGASISTSSSDYTDSDSGLLACGVLTIIFLAVEILILFSGVTLFYDRLNLFQSIFHCVGTVLYAWFNLEAWNWYTLWYVWIFFSLLPMVVESFSALTSFIYYKQLNR